MDSLSVVLGIGGVSVPGSCWGWQPGRVGLRHASGLFFLQYFNRIQEGYGALLRKNQCQPTSCIQLS